MKEQSVGATGHALRQSALMLVILASCVRPGLAADSDGKALLQNNCGRCHAVVAGEASPLKQAPNLWDVLGSYPDERLDFELAEGIGSRHEAMPQIQFSDEDTTAIYYYLHGSGDGSKTQQ